ncbi:hypothetical protein AAVH_15479 [Aphelenchoides avenae]|nr:hypothetical protein AAVH_15479 [Aphelenchus avenae]
MLPAYVALSIALEFLLILFHLSVTAFIACQIFVGPKQYRNAFFVIYLLQSVADLADYLTVQYLIRLPQYNIIPSTIVEPVGPLLFFGTAYFQFFQFLSHMAIALNRYTAIRHPTRHENIWHGRLFGVILVLMFSVPLLAAVVRLWFVTSVVDDGGGYQLVNNDSLTDVVG